MAPSGIEPATCRLVEQCLNHGVPPFVECSSHNELQRVQTNCQRPLHTCVAGSCRFESNIDIITAICTKLPVCNFHNLYSFVRCVSYGNREIFMLIMATLPSTLILYL